MRDRRCGNMSSSDHMSLRYNAFEAQSENSRMARRFEYRSEPRSLLSSNSTIYRCAAENNAIAVPQYKKSSIRPATVQTYPCHFGVVRIGSGADDYGLLERRGQCVARVRPDMIIYDSFRSIK